MSVLLTVNGISYDYPEQNDQNWGPDATSWASAVTSGMLQKSGGLFQLLAETDFGSAYGIKSLYYKSRSANIASAGQIRLARTDVISFRNNANSADLDLGVDTSNRLTFNGAAFVSSGSIVNADISASAAIAFSKMAALTASRALVSDASGVVSVSTVTSTELGYVSGVTSAIQTQLNAKAPTASPTFTGIVTTPDLILSALTATTVPYLDSSKQMKSSAVTPTELGYVSGVTSAIQTQLNAKLAAAGGTISGNLIISGDLTVNGTTTTINTTNLDVTDKNILVNKGGNDAASEGAGLTVDRTGVKGSIIYASAAASKFKIGNLGSEIEIADISSSQSFSNKTLVSPVVSSATASTVAIYDGSKVLGSSSVTSTELGYVSGVTSSIQTQLNAKAPTASPTFSGTITTALTASRAVVTNGSSQLAASSVTSTELGYLSGVTSAIQTQINSKATAQTIVTPVSFPHTAVNNTIILVTTTSARSIQLPAPANGIQIIIKDISGQANTNNITVLRNGTEQIEGVAASRVLSSNWGSWMFISDGTNWYMI